MSIKNEFCQIFEYELKKKLSERSKSTIDEIRLLVNSFKFYDLDYIGIIDKNQWVRGILKTGLAGFTENDLLSIFPYYDKNNSGLIDYKNFSNYLYGREQLNPLQKEPNVNMFQPYNNISIKNSSYNKHNSNNNNNYDINNDYSNNQNTFNKNNTYLNNQNNLNTRLKNNNIIDKKDIISKEEQIKNYFESLLMKIKNKIHTNNGITFYVFAKKLKLYEVNNKINLTDLIQIFKEMKLDLTENDIKNFFLIIDYNQMKFIDVNDIIKIIKGQMNQQRKILVMNKFNIIDKTQKGEVNTNFLKIMYKNNAKYHPDVIQGTKTEDAKYNQFRQTLELFLDINKILNEILTKEQFIDYYSGISASISDDKYFEDILNAIWDLTKLYSNGSVKDNNNNYNNNIYKDNNHGPNNYKVNSYFDNYNNYTNNLQKNNKRYLSKSLSTPHINAQKYVQTPYYNNNNLKNNILQMNSNNLNSINTPNNLYNNENNRYNQNFNREEKSYMNNINSISDPYYRPRITPGGKGIKIFKKIIYNPITKELLYSNNFNEKYNNEQNVVNKDINQSTMKRYKNNKFIFDEDKYKEQILIELFNKFRNEIISKGEQSIFTLQNILNKFNTDYHPNLISFDNFCDLFQELDIKNCNIDEIKIIFEYFEQNNKGYINYDNFFKYLVGYMGRNRQVLVRQIYDSLRKDQNGNVFVVDFKKLFNADKYNEIFCGKKSKEYVYYEFIDNLETFLNYRNKLYNKNLSSILNYDDFLRFFDQISMYINSDETFEKYINTCWKSNIYTSNENNINYNNMKYKNAMIRTGSQIINW